jgi:hypothetical protein
MGSARLTGMQTWTIAVNENGYIIKGVSELPAYLVKENGYDFETFDWTWTRTDILIFRRIPRGDSAKRSRYHVGRG